MLYDKVINGASEEYKYQMLDRLESDCIYFVKYGNKNVKYLYFKDVKKHIKAMIKLYKSIKVKPKWLTKKDIITYYKMMKTV